MEQRSVIGESALAKDPSGVRPTPPRETVVRRFFGTSRVSFGFAWRSLFAAGVLIVVDWLAVLTCLAVVWSLRRWLVSDVFPNLDPITPFSVFLADLYFLLPWTFAFAESRLYTRRALFWDETKDALRACTLAALFAVFLSFVVRSTGGLSRLVIAGVWATTLIVVPLLRYNAKRLMVAVGLWGKRVLIVGAGETGVQVCERVRAHPVLGYEPVAFVDDDPEKIGRVCFGLPVCGPVAQIPEFVRALAVRDIVVAMPRLPREQLLHVIAACEGHVESIRLVPDMFGLATVGVETEDLDGMLLLNMRWNLAKPWNIALKRGFDLAVATLTALVLSPFLLLAAVAIRIDSPGPILYRQRRLGRGWGEFRCMKFRTMYRDNEERLRAYLERNPAAGEEWRRFAKLKSYDPRVTRVGRLLRRFSFDELPQLINVSRGEMSLVGPRPYLPREAERMGDFAQTILKAPPGISGLWQVSGRNELTFDQRLRLDEYYVRNWSLWLDIIVLIKTVGAVIWRRGAY
jgi:Undecaprenyl-phosphate galactose phosphotransferase WbaP